MPDKDDKIKEINSVFKSSGASKKYKAKAALVDGKVVYSMLVGGERDPHVANVPFTKIVSILPAKDGKRLAKKYGKPAPQPASEKKPKVEKPTKKPKTEPVHQHVFTFKIDTVVDNEPKHATKTVKATGKATAVSAILAELKGKLQYRYKLVKRDGDAVDGQWVESSAEQPKPAKPKTKPAKPKAEKKPAGKPTAAQVRGEYKTRAIAHASARVGQGAKANPRNVPVEKPQGIAEKVDVTSIVNKIIDEEGLSGSREKAFKDAAIMFELHYERSAKKGSMEVVRRLENLNDPNATMSKIASGSDPGLHWAFTPDAFIAEDENKWDVEIEGRIPHSSIKVEETLRTLAKYPEEAEIVHTGTPKVDTLTNLHSGRTIKVGSTKKKPAKQGIAEKAGVETKAEAGAGGPKVTIKQYLRKHATREGLSEKEAAKTISDFEAQAIDDMITKGKVEGFDTKRTDKGWHAFLRKQRGNITVFIEREHGHEMAVSYMQKNKSVSVVKGKVDEPEYRQQVRRAAFKGKAENGTLDIDGHTVELSFGGNKKHGKGRGKGSKPTSSPAKPAPAKRTAPPARPRKPKPETKKAEPEKKPTISSALAKERDSTIDLFEAILKNTEDVTIHEKFVNSVTGMIQKLKADKTDDELQSGLKWARGRVLEGFYKAVESDITYWEGESKRRGASLGGDDAVPAAEVYLDKRHAEEMEKWLNKIKNKNLVIPIPTLEKTAIIVGKEIADMRPKEDKYVYGTLRPIGLAGIPVHTVIDEIVKTNLGVKRDDVKASTFDIVPRPETNDVWTQFRITTNYPLPQKALQRFEFMDVTKDQEKRDAPKAAEPAKPTKREWEGKDIELFQITNTNLETVLRTFYTQDNDVYVWLDTKTGKIHVVTPWKEFDDKRYVQLAGLNYEAAEEQSRADIIDGAVKKARAKLKEIQGKGKAEEKTEPKVEKKPEPKAEQEKGLELMKGLVEDDPSSTGAFKF